MISDRPGAFGADDLDLFQELGRRAGVVLENARLYTEAQKANRLKDEFVAIVSHELRTPLTPILGGVYMLRSEPRDEKVFARALNLIERNAKTQVKIVDDLLDVSRIISGKLRLNMESVDLAAVMQSAVETVRPLIEQRGHDLTVGYTGAAGARRRRPSAPGTGPLQSSEQGCEVHRAGRKRHAHRTRSGQRGDRIGQGQRHRHSGRNAVEGVRSLHADRTAAGAIPGRARHRPYAGEAPGRDARRKRRSAQ